jgi:hypothetical protein
MFMSPMIRSKYEGPIIVLADVAFHAHFDAVETGS